MVYRKYIRRGGKIYGPYHYHSRKVNGKVVTDYLGKNMKTKRDKILIFLIFGLIAVFIIIFSLNYKSITGFGIYEEDEQEQTIDSLAFIRLVIEIEEAQHLDLNRNFISDIYNEVKELDDIWSEPILSGDYVRIVFEDNLTSENDIKIYPRVVSGNPKIEVYELDGKEVIVEFNNIISNQYNKILLTNLQGSQDSFDLRVLGGSLEIDHIFDPPIETLNPIEHINTENNLIDLITQQVSDISTDDTANVAVAKSTLMTVEFNTTSQEIDTVNDLDCSLVYSTDDIETNGRFMMYDSFGGNQLGSTATITISEGADNTIYVNDLHLDGDFSASDVDTIVAYIYNDDGADPDNVYVDDVECIIDYTEIVQDNTYPTFSGYADSPVNNTVYLAGATTYQFNVSVADTNGTVELEFDGTNYTATNYSLAPSMYNVSFVKDLEVKQHSYYWWSRGSGFNNNFNASLNRTYVIVNATPEGSLTNDTALTRDHDGSMTTIDYTESNLGDANVVYKIFRNGVDVGTPPDVMGSAGIYDYVLNTTGGANYSANASMDTFTLTINQIASEVNLTLNYNQSNITIPTGYTIDLNCSTVTGEGSAYLSMYRDGTLINNGTSPIGNRTTFSSSEIINFTCFYNSQNYTTSSDTWWLNVTGVSDLTPPNVTSLTETPTDSSMYFPTTTYEFNATIIDDTGIDTVLLEFDGVNYTATNLSADIYNISLRGLSAGTYDYRWFVNDTNNNINNTETGSYTIDQAPTNTTLRVTPSSPITYPTASNFSCVNNESLTIILYIDDIVKTPENHLNLVRSADEGGMNVSCIATANTNYSSNSDETSYIINKAVLEGSLTNDTALTRDYDGTVTSISYSANNLGDGGVSYTIHKNNVNVGTSDKEGSAGIYNYILNSTGGTNYSANASIDSFTLTINQITPSLSINADPSWSETYPTSVNVSGSGCPSELTCYLNKNDIGVISNGLDLVYSAGIYNFTYNTSGNDNYTAGSVSNDLVISQAIPEGSLTSSNGWTINYAEGTTIGVSETNDGDDGVSYDVFREGINVGTGSINLSVGIYDYVLNTTGGTNWSINASMDTETLIISQIASSLNLTLDDSQSNTSVSKDSSIDLNCSRITGDSGATLRLYNDGSLINEDTSSKIGNTTTFLTTGTFNITCVYIETTNFTQSSDEWWVEVNDTVNPNINITYPINNTNHSLNTIPVNYTYSDDVALSSCWYSNDTFTTNTTITCGDNITIIWADGQHNISVWINDTSNNLNSSSVTFTIDITPPYFTTISNRTIPQTNSLDYDIDAIDDTIGVECFSVNDTTNFQITCAGVLTNKTGLSVQLYNINISVNDTLGNLNSSLIWINVTYVDSIEPNITIAYPQNTSYSVNVSEINYTATDDVSLYRCWYSLNQGSTNTTIDCGNNVSGLNSGQGSSTWTVYANDTSGNENSTSITFFVDSITPDINFVSPTTIEGNHTQNYIKANVTANDSGLDSITIFLYNSTDLVNSSINSISPYFLQFVNLSGETYYLNASANDTLGNENYTETRIITLNVSAPSLTIIRPKNNTYFENQSLKIHINTNADNSWYNIDNGKNESIEGQTYFNTTVGSHTVYVFANNSFGITIGNVTFNIGDNLFEIYSNNFTGNSTNFNEFSIEEIQNLSGVILENPEFGKIHFNEIINLTDDENSNDNQSNLNDNINISFNRIELNSTALSNFNKSATLTLYNLTFTNPRILKDGTICPSSICTEIDYSGGILLFNVTSFTIYSAEQTPSEEEEVEEERRGGGGGGWFIQRCSKNSDCESDEVCLNQKCVKLFDIKIIDFGSPVKLGEFFEFTYSVKGMANISGDIEVNFWIEKEKEIITSGLDTIYLGSYEEKIETTKIFLPSNIDSGIYQFFVQVNHRDYKVQSHRTIEIEVKGKIAEITPVDEKIGINYFFYILGALLIILIILELIRIAKKGDWKESIKNWKERRKIEEEIKVKKIKIDFLSFYRKMNKKIRGFIKNLINFLRPSRHEKMYKPKKIDILEPPKPQLEFEKPKIKEIKTQELPKEKPEKKTAEQIIEEIKKTTSEFPTKKSEKGTFDIIEDIAKKEKEKKQIS